MKRTILVIGIGAGNPEHLTLQAIAAMNRADVFFIPDKGAEKSELAALRHAMIARFVTRPDVPTVGYAMPRRDAETDYRAGVDDWHEAIAQIFGRLIEAELAGGGTGAFLVWGDPAFYDSTLRILDRLQAGGRLELQVEVVPGISAVQALAAQHRVPLNAIGEPVLITTGRRLARGLDATAGNVVVMLDGEQAFHHADPDLEILWGAYLGTADELLIAGRLGDVAGEIDAARREARARKGWIMDTYLLRRRG